MKRLFKLLVLLGFTLMLLLYWQALTPAQDSFLSSRVTRLEAENGILRSRIGRLENQVLRVSSEVGLDYATPSEVDIPQSAPSSPALLSEDPMFDRLATLAIELKERIVILEQQVADLQTRIPRQ